MAIKLRCPSCNVGLSVADRKAGQTIRCPGCKAEVLVPSTEGDEALPAAPVPVPAVGAVVESGPPVSRRDWDDEPEDDDEGMSIRKPETDLGEMDLTPMVDVTFQLLIFFMITASFTIQKVMSYPPPDPEQEGVSQVVQKLEDVEKDAIVIEVDENNRFTVENQPIADRSQLQAEIERYRRTKKTNEVMVKRHYFSSNEMTVAAVDAAKAAGIQRIRTAILPRTGPRK